MSENSHIRSTQITDTGGGIELEVIELKDGLTLVISDEIITVYLSPDDFWEGTTEGPDNLITLTILRETGKELDFANPPPSAGGRAHPR